MGTTTNSLIVSNNAKIDGKLIVNKITSVEDEIAGVTPYINLGLLTTISGAGETKIECGYDNNIHYVKLTANSDYLNLDGTANSATLSAPEINLTADNTINIGKIDTSNKLLCSEINLYSNSMKVYEFETATSYTNYMDIRPGRFYIKKYNDDNLKVVNIPTKTCTLIGTTGSDNSSLVKGDGTWFSPIKINGNKFSSFSESTSLYAPTSTSSFPSSANSTYYYAECSLKKGSTTPVFTFPGATNRYNRCFYLGTVSKNASFTLGVNLRYCRAATFVVQRGTDAMDSITLVGSCFYNVSDGSSPQTTTRYWHIGDQSYRMWIKVTPASMTATTTISVDSDGDFGSNALHTLYCLVLF